MRYKENVKEIEAVARWPSTRRVCPRIGRRTKFGLIAALVNAGVPPGNIHAEHVSALAKRRPKLEMALKDARGQDTFVVWKLDRLARDMDDLLRILRQLDAAGVSFKSLTEGFDTSTSVGKLLIHVLAALVQFERDRVVERTRAGVGPRGGKIGQPAKIVGKKYERGERMLKAGKSVTVVAAALGATPATVYSTYTSEKVRQWRLAAKG